MELIIAAVVVAVAIAALLTWVIWRAVGAAIDWLIETFGNDPSKDARRGADSRRRPR